MSAEAKCIDCQGWCHHAAVRCSACHRAMQRRVSRERFACIDCGSRRKPEGKRCMPCHLKHVRVEWLCQDCGSECSEGASRCRPCHLMNLRDSMTRCAGCGTIIRSTQRRCASCHNNHSRSGTRSAVEEMDWAIDYGYDPSEMARDIADSRGVKVASLARSMYRVGRKDLVQYFK